MTCICTQDSTCITVTVYFLNIYSTSKIYKTTALTIYLAKQENCNITLFPTILVQIIHYNIAIIKTKFLIIFLLLNNKFLYLLLLFISEGEKNTYPFSCARKINI